MMKKEQQSLKRPVPNTSLSSSSNSSSNPINKSSKNIEMNLDERMKRNAEKRKKRKLWKEKQRKLMEPIELFGLRYFYPYIGGKKGMKRVICDHPMSADKIEIIHNHDNLIVINKTAPLNSIKCVGYGQSNIRSAIKKQLDLHGRFSLAHRLDVCTTGVVMSTTEKKVASRLQAMIQERDVSKIYMARVCGSFPENQLIECKKQIKNGRNHLSEAITYFLRVKETNKCDDVEPSSLVICFPKTGRKHQIRIHLKELGYPIANDPLHGGHNKLKYEDPYRDDDDGKLLKMLLHAYEKYKNEKGVDMSEIEMHIQACKSRKNNNNKDDYVEGPWGNCCTRPIYLHAWIYGGNNGMFENDNNNNNNKPWQFSATLPTWAKFTMPSMYKNKNDLMEKLGLDALSAKLVYDNIIM